MSSAFGGPLDLKLIDLVRENQLLYKPSHPKYSDSDTREVVWQKIGDALHRPAAEFAGIQCHIQFGDFHEEKHKPGFIENLSEYLPEQYCSSWSIEKKILKEYSKHVALNELEAKHLYTKTARALPTYGVTFFLVKEKQKGKKKLVPRLLGINSDAILRLDETTKEILQQWPLTHVKTYYAGKGETFTLNFGDYSDKEYSVKTRDALRIRDILEGYIDLIRKRMMATYNQSQNEYGCISQDNISSGQASMVQHVSSSPMKIVEQSCVGPSKIIQYEPGQKAIQGTQMITVQQILTSDLINKQGQGVKGEVPMRKSIPFTKRLNRMNSNSVKIVTLLSEPSQAKIEDSQIIVDEMNAEMPFIRDGVKETVANRPNDDEKKKLQDQLHSLEELMKLLFESSKPGSVNTSEADDAAKQIADLTTQMYFAMDPKTQRRSRILSKSRTSFIADEKTERNLRRASFIAATATANHAIDNAEELLDKEFKGPALNPEQVEELERSAIDKLGKINAAIGHYSLAHSDPQNIDYTAAVNSLNTIHELVPELAKDGQALASVKDGKSRQDLLADSKELCAAAKHVCSLSGVEDAEKLQNASAKYSDVAGRLVFTFGRGSKARADKENEVIELAKAAGDRASLLLTSAQALPEMASAERGAAAARAAAAATELLAQAQLNAPTISEPHCQSALTAASEALSSSAQQLAATWKPLVEDPARHEIGERLHNRTMDLAKALDRLRESYANLGDMQDGSDAPKTNDEAERLKFINTVSTLGGNLQAAGNDLNIPLISQVKDAEAKEAELRLSKRLAQLNAAIASLLSATSDSEHPDYATAELALRTINELMPEVVKDSKTASANRGASQRAALLDNMKALCAATDYICASSCGAAKPEELSAAVNSYTDASGRLTYVVNGRANPDRESEIMHESTAACNQAGILLSGVQQLSEAVKGERGAELDAKGAALADAAQSLLTTAQVTAASMSDPRCQSAVLSSVDKVSSSGTQLARCWAPLAGDAEREPRAQALNGALKQLEAQLDKLRAACRVPGQDVEQSQDPLQKQQKLQFVMSMNGAKAKLADAQRELDKPTMAAKGADIEKVQKRLSLGLGQLNAAIASLLAATADCENPDYVAAEKAANTIAELMPHVVHDTKTVSGSAEEPRRAAMLSQLKELCEASERICHAADGSNTQGLNDAVAKFTNASGKLVYVVSPRVNPVRDEQIVTLSSGACGETSQLLSGVAALAAAVGGDRGQQLDARGGRVADAANSMLQTAQITAPSMSSRDCQDAFLSSVDSLSGAGRQLGASFAPLDSDPKHKKQSQALQQALQQLEAQLEALRQACKTSEGDVQDASQKQQKLEFIKSMRGAKERLGDAHKELNKPTKPVKGAGMKEVQQRLSERMGKLNAAIAALLAATADRENPDYVAAQKATNTIAELVPHVIQDTKTVSASAEEPRRAAMLSQLKELCEASERICHAADGSNTQGLKDAVAKFTNASGKLVYVVSPRVNTVKDDRIVTLSSGACGETSQLLSGVAALAAAVGGDRGQQLDARGGRVADAANSMLQTAQITAPSMSSRDCQDAFLSSVDSLSGAGRQLGASLAPLDSDPKHKKQSQALQQALQQLEAQLETLRQACKTSEGDVQDLSQKQQKLEFIKSMRGAKERLGDAHKELNKPTKPVKGAGMEEVQQRLSERMGKLNAAIAALLAATADRENPDYVAAQKATNTIAELVPRVIQDTKTVSGSAEEPRRAAMLSQLKELCEASERICHAADGSNTQGLKDAVDKFTNASGKLVYVVSPRVNPVKDDQIVTLSSGACGETSQLLSGVAALAAAVGGDRGQQLDARGGRVADAANSMLQTAQITAPSMSSWDCQDAFLSSVDSLSGAGRQLGASLAPLDSDPKHKKQSQALQQALQQLEAQLEALRQACKTSDGDLQDPSQNQQKLEFIKSMRGAKERLGDAHKELNKPTKPVKGAGMEEVQQRLSERMGKLNAAIAALLAATADRENPDYVAAQKATNTIAELVPRVIQDTKTVSASAEEPRRAAMLSQLKELCEASERICHAADGSNTQGLKDAVDKFTNASGKLVYVVSPRVNPVKDDQIVTLSSGACGETSQLLSGVAALAAAVGGDRGQQLDARGGRVADAAQAMLQTAQITAPSMSSPHCQDTLLSSVDNLSGAGQQLAASLAPLNSDLKHKKQSQALQQALQQLEAQLEALRQACKEAEVGESLDPSQKQQKLQFIKTMQGAKGKLGDAQKELNKPTKPAKGAAVEEVQLRLSDRLGQLNAAIASLLAATADREKPDYAAAEQAATTIADLMRHVIQDTKTVSGSAEEPRRAAMLSQLKELCEASERICQAADGSNTQGLNDAVAKFTDASGKLVYVVSPRVNPVRDEQIVDLSTGAANQTSQLLAGVAQLAEQLGGEKGQQLDAQGGRMADAAETMLQTAQITAPSMSSPHCQDTLLSSVDNFSGAGQQLAASLAPLNTDAKHKKQSQALQQALQQLEAQLEALRQACKAHEVGESQGPSQKQQKLQFIKTMQGAKGKLEDAQKELNKPTKPAKGAAVEEVQLRLSDRLGQLNAAIASLLAATADREKPDYAAAEQAATTIADLMRHVIQDTKTVSASAEAPRRAAMLSQLKELCEASERICHGAADSNQEGLNDAIAKYTDASSKLVYGACPHVNPQRESQIVGLSTGAGSETSQLLSGVAALAAAVGGDRGQQLDARGGRVADAAQAMLQAAQITAPSISSPHCQNALLSSVEQLSSSAHQLSTSLAPLHDDPKYSSQTRKLNQALQQLQAQLDALKKACLAPDTAPPSVSKKPPPPATKPTAGRTDGSQYTIAYAEPKQRTSTDITHDFLERLRCEESMGQNPIPPALPKSTCPAVVGKAEEVQPPPERRTAGEERLRQQFVTSVEDADKRIKENKASLVKLSNQDTGTGPALSHSEMMKKQQALQHNLALASVEVATLVAANYDDKIDYTAASKSASTLSHLMTSIVQDGKQLSDNVNEMARKAFLYDLLQLCESSANICDAAKADRLKLNEAAVEFSGRSTKLLYVVSNDVDSALEKEIISRAKAIGDSASRLAEDAAGVAAAASGTAASSVQEICVAGTACVDAAGKLVYTAKLTAPSINETPCQDALVSSTETLSTKLKGFSVSWEPLSSDPHQAKIIRDLTKEAENLERILEGLRSDVKGGKIGKRREMEQLVIEDTPMRQLTVKILDDAKTYAEASELPAPQKIEYAAYADKLKGALRALDLACARCKKTPHDTNKRRELENAIQNLQMILLQSRPKKGDKVKSNIVDLRDFIDEVSSEGRNLSATVNGVKVPAAQDKRILEEIKEKCSCIETKAHNLMNVDSRTDLDSTFNDILEVDQFGQECDDLIKEINADLKGMEDVKAKRLLYSKILPLSESCNMLRFATKSGVSTAAGAALDSSLDDLDDIESRVITSIVPDVADGVVLRSKQPRPAGYSTATINLCREVALSSSGVAPSTVTAYIADAVSNTDTNNPEEKNKLLKHLYKLVHLLKTLTVAAGTRSAAWQLVDGPELAAITEQILKEIHKPESKFGVKGGEEKNNIISESDVVKLLIPSAPKILGDQKQQEDKLVQLAAQLSSSCGQVSAGGAAARGAAAGGAAERGAAVRGAGGALSRPAHAAAGAALELDAVARGCTTRNPMQSKRVDEAAKEMSFATYNVLKTAESASQDPNNHNLKRRLVDACEMLDLSINKLVSAASSAPALQQQCGELQRSTALQLSALQPRALSAVPFHDSCMQLTQQRDNIYKLKSEGGAPRQQFLRSVRDIGAAARRSARSAAHCAYYIAISDHHKDIANTGLVDVPHIQKSIESIQNSCMAIIGSSHIFQAKEEKHDLVRRVQELSGALDRAHLVLQDAGVKRSLLQAKSCVSDAAADLETHLKDEGDMGKVTSKAVSLLEAVNRAHGMVERCPLVPEVGDMSADTKASCDEVINHAKSLLTNTLALLKDVNSSPEEQETMTWVTFNTSRKQVLDAYDALVKSVQKNGHRAGIIEKAPEEEKEELKKSYIEIQVDLANRWLKSPSCKEEAKDMGQRAARNVLDMARQISEDLKGSDREEIRNVITESEELLYECTKKYDHEKNSVLMDRIKELKKSIQRGVVTRVVEDFIEAEAPLDDLDVLADSETDESKRKFILERKIASLLAQLCRVSTTARVVGGASQHLAAELAQCSQQTELLAPMLVQSAQQRIDNPDNAVIVENYKSLLAKYAESISKVRDLCDRAVDPMDFVQTAGDTMQRMREDMTQHNNDPQKCAHASSAITRLANRVMHVSMSAPAAARDAELRRALAAAQRRLRAAAAPRARAGRLPHWRDVTAEILRTTGDVESALGGENIFKKQPSTANQHIYAGAAALHRAVAGWSAHDNEIVSVARRTAVLMARLSEYMETDKKEALIATSKSIVIESQEVAELGKKLAHECCDVRIKNNLLQTCERIPTISGQLKMLTTVKGSSLGHQGSAEDKEAMDMLVGNAQSLMMSIQEVVKAAASASVKIMSQRGPRLRWVRKNYY